MKNTALGATGALRKITMGTQAPDASELTKYDVLYEIRTDGIYEISYDGKVKSPPTVEFPRVLMSNQVNVKVGSFFYSYLDQIDLNGVTYGPCIQQTYEIKSPILEKVFCENKGLMKFKSGTSDVARNFHFKINDKGQFEPDDQFLNGPLPIQIQKSMQSCMANKYKVGMSKAVFGYLTKDCPADCFRQGGFSYCNKWYYDLVHCTECFEK